MSLTLTPVFPPKTAPRGVGHFNVYHLVIPVGGKASLECSGVTFVYIHDHHNFNGNPVGITVDTADGNEVSCDRVTQVRTAKFRRLFFRALNPVNPAGFYVVVSENPEFLYVPNW